MPLNPSQPTRVHLHHLYVSPGHNFVGHHGGPPGEHPIEDRPSIRCRAGRGIEGDRYFDHQENYKGQITFFSQDIFEALCDHVGASAVEPSAMRRNVLVSGVDLNQLIDAEFELQGVRFFGVEECRPCYWMNLSVGAGAEEFLQGNGGLRARILSDGELRRGPALLTILSAKSAGA